MLSKKVIAVLMGLITLGTVGVGFNLWGGNDHLLFAKGDPYEKLWKRVDSCENKGLTESAMKIVQEIYGRSKNEKNPAQFVKAVIYRMKFDKYKEEFSLEKTINDLTREVETADFPAKPVLQSILADSYWQYYQVNRWKFYNRSQTVNFNKEDIATYDLKAIISAAAINYNASLSDVSRLKETKVGVFDEVIVRGTHSTRAWRPTLYDFLAHRALDFFKDGKADVIVSGNQFAVNDAAFLKPYPVFLNCSVEKPQDSLDLKYYAVKLFQDLEQFHVQTNNQEALVDLEMQRLGFFKENSKNELKDTLYLQSLAWLGKHFEKSSRLAEIKHLEAEWWLANAIHYKPLDSDRFKWNKKKALGICEEIVKNYPGSRGSQLAKNTISSIKAKSLSLITEQVNDVGMPNRALVNYGNISKIYFKVVKTDYFDYSELVRKYYGKDLITRLLGLPKTQVFEQVLPDDNDYNAHACEVKIPAMGAGYYVLVASDSPQFSVKDNDVNYQLYVVSDISYLNKRKKSDGYDFYTLDRQSGKALKNVSAQVWYNTYNYKSNKYDYQKGKLYTSDENGHVFIEANDSNAGNFFVGLTNGNDQLFSVDNFSSYKEYEGGQVETRSFIFTDRAIYRPGQIVYFKSILLQGSKNKQEVLANTPLTVYFHDVNNQLISSQDLITNAYGSVSGSFVAPQGVLTGQMRISNNYATTYVSVEEYKRPKFETQFDTLKGSYQLNDEVSVKGFARAYAGNMVDGAGVKYRVVRRVNYPYWWYWYKPYYSGGSTEVEMTNGNTTTDASGYFEIKFKALPDPTANKSDNPTYTYEIHVDVTDVNGETRSNTVDFRVGYKTLELRVVSPDVLNVKDLPKMSVVAQNLNGVEEFVSGTLSVYELKQPAKVFRKRLWEQPDKHLYTQQEYYQLFPNDLYDDETNHYKWEKLKKSFTRNFNTATDKNRVITEFKNLTPGVYLVEGVCKDKFGEEVKSVNYLTVYDPSSAELPIKSPQWTHALKTTVEPGEKASFVVASSYTAVNCLYELENEQGAKQNFIAPSLKPIEVAVEEINRGGMMATTHFIKYGRIYSSSHYITVPFSNKELSIEYTSFRNKLIPGQGEEWKLEVKHKKGDKAAAEMLAAMYDASLDAFRPNNWDFGIYAGFYPRYQWTHSLEGQNYSQQVSNNSLSYVYVDEISYDGLNYFGMNYYGYGYYGRANLQAVSIKSKSGRRHRDEAEEDLAAPAAAMSEVSSDSFSAGNGAPAEKAGESKKEMSAGPKTAGKEDAPVAARKNFNETAFFFPELRTNENGEVIIKFTIPESLTKWKFMGFAHTKDLSFGQTQQEVVTQKELMVVPNAPRFFRENDQITFIAKISNLSENDLIGKAEIKFYDAFTEEDITAKIIAVNEGAKNFAVKKGQSMPVEWGIHIPEGVQAIKYRVIAKAGNFSDGEEMVVPVLTNRMLVTESMPLPVRGNQTKEFNFTKFIDQNNHSTTLKNHAYTLEFTANPAWYAVQSLPYLMEYPYECAEQTFARYYSNALATYIVNSKPKIKQVFDSWKITSPETFLSNLEKNQELKALVLEETPWLLQAKNESENKKRVALLFDLNKMSQELGGALNKLEKMQTVNGGWPWFQGCPEDWYITQHILSSFGHLQKLGVINPEKDPRIFSMIRNAIPFCDNKLKQHFDQMKKYSKNYLSENHLDYMAIQYLYMRSYFKDQEMSRPNKEAFEYYKKQAQKYWLDNSRYMQGMLTLALHRYEDKKTPLDILKSLKENSLTSEEMGMYWKENYGGYYWYQAPIEMQALMIEAFDEVLNDTRIVDDLKTWLIKSKQTQHWGTTRATTEAVYALLLRGTDWLATEPNVEIRMGDVKLDLKNDPTLKSEAGTGYFKKTYRGSDINPSMGKVKVTKTDAGVSWGAVYWQYFEQLDKITPHETPLKLSKKLFVEVNTASGPVITPVVATTKLKVGDKIKVRIELRSDRDMEYVHLKDMRASGFEPVNVFSGYRYQDGLSYYESTRDAATNFFISYLPKGTYVFEYPVWVSHAGNFSNGISSIQCMYAPEFTSHSEGIRVQIGNK